MPSSHTAENARQAISARCEDWHGPLRYAQDDKASCCCPAATPPRSPSVRNPLHRHPTIAPARLCNPSLRRLPGTPHWRTSCPPAAGRPPSRPSFPSPLRTDVASSMRVLLLNYEFPPLGGGAGVATQALGRGLASRGVTVDVVTAGEKEESADGSALGRARHAGRPAHGVPGEEPAHRRARGGHGRRAELPPRRAPPGAGPDARRPLRHRASVLLAPDRGDAAAHVAWATRRSSSPCAAPTSPATIPASRGSTGRTGCCARSPAGSGAGPTAWSRVCEQPRPPRDAHRPAAALLGHPQRRGPRPLPSVEPGTLPPSGRRALPRRRPAGGAQGHRGSHPRDRHAGARALSSSRSWARGPTSRS